MEKKIVLKKIRRGDPNTTLADVLEMIEKFQEIYPDMEIFWDGDEYAICGRKKRTEQMEIDEFVD